MDIPLVTDEKDPKWTLLAKILDRITSRRAKQEMAKQRIIGDSTDVSLDLNWFKKEKNSQEWGYNYL